MNIVSVINYKGGVGKTTLTANLGAELAYRGQRVLLIDIDPQASLTFSFYDPVRWEKELADDRTILHWFDAFTYRYQPADLATFVVTPEPVNARIGENGGRLDLVASHLGLIDVDLDLAANLGGAKFQMHHPEYIRTHRLLANALAGDEFAHYDTVLIDCPPNFGMITRAAIVASRHILVPARPDYLSTLGISYLRRKLTELVDDFNGTAAPPERIDPMILGVVYTMIQYAGSQPLIAQRNFLRLDDAIEVPVFRQWLRDSKTSFTEAGEDGIPAVLAGRTADHVQYELQELTNEFLARIRY